MSVMHFRLTETPPTLEPREAVNYRALALEVQGTRRYVPEVWDTLTPHEKRAAYTEVRRHFSTLLEGHIALESLSAWAHTLRLLSPESFEGYLAYLHEYQGFMQDVVLLYELEQDPDGTAWQAADLSRLGEYAPYDWGDTDPNTVGQPLERQGGRVVIVGDGE